MTIIAVLYAHTARSDIAYKKEIYDNILSFFFSPIWLPQPYIYMRALDHNEMVLNSNIIRDANYNF